MLIINCIHHTKDYLFASFVYLLCLSVIPQWERHLQWQENDLWVIVKQMDGLHIDKKTDKKTKPKCLQYKSDFSSIYLLTFHCSM